MSHTLRDQKKLLARTRRIQGQAAALATLLENGSDCADVLQQIAALRGAVNGLMGAVLTEHLTVHLVEENELAKRREDLDVVQQVIRSYLK
ncbi:metal-sensing transcriptional repressor [Chitinilyticum piscinae]|uniref:Metal-sensing transcriptional repressor n=1 Tax=Chitinilyticum piscinae TaxID=2866724 RepID=A0A8J7FKS8_9NEIS|nr:metal-sensing transcriptional repressor [Chitinilyticum piscinae]MBE9607966.1 metal-sensing transcriptional repressor [Chitinilyticum piscinae]